MSNKSSFQCSLGTAFYYYLVSIVLLLVGSLAHFHTWMEVYFFCKSDQYTAGTHDSSANSQELRLFQDERRPTFLTV